MTKLGRELASKGVDVISLSIGEPDFDTPAHIVEAAKKALDEGYTHYTPVPGFLELREAISKKFKRDNGLEYNTNQIVVSTGAKHSLMNTFLSIINPGDEVIVPTPYWVSYVDMIHHCQGKAITIPTTIKNDYLPNIEDIRKIVTPKTKAIIFSSPCNPSGSVYPKELLEGIANIVAENPQMVVISDEIYEHINYTDQHCSIGTFKNIKDQVVTVNGLAKGFAMTGWRIGYVGAPVEIAKAIEKLQGQYTSGTNSIAQRAAIVALGDNLTPTLAMKETFLKRRGLILELLKNIPPLKNNVPNGAFYVFPDVSYYFGKSYESYHIKDADDLSIYLLEVAHVTVVSGSAFGMDQCIRISYAASEERITEAIKRIKTALEKLN
jgi:aspartate aminotransferase